MDQETFRKVLFPSKHKLYRFALMFLHNNEEAEDIVQEVYMKMWDKRTEMTEIENYEAYAMKMIRNFCLDKIRRNKNKRMISIEGHDEEDSGISPFLQVSFKNLKELMLKLIDTLPEQQKTIMFMRDIEHHSFEEIALMTNMTVNNVRVNLSRARKNVRKNYTKIRSMENYRKPAS